MSIINNNKKNFFLLLCFESKSEKNIKRKTTSQRERERESIFIGFKT